MGARKVCFPQGRWRFLTWGEDGKVMFVCSCYLGGRSILLWVLLVFTERCLEGMSCYADVTAWDVAAGKCSGGQP